MAERRCADTLGELPAVTAHRFGTRTAVVAGAEELSFNEIERRVAAIALGLAQLGLNTGDRVILYLTLREASHRAGQTYCLLYFWIGLPDHLSR